MFELIPSYLIPVAIFLARICDVSMGTIRILFVSRGMKLRAALLGFVEILIWIMVVAHLIQHLDNWINYIAYAGGFSAGTYLGIIVESKMKVGTVIVRVITSEDGSELIEKLRTSGFMVTRFNAEGRDGPVVIIFSILKRKRWNEIIGIIESYDTDAFYSVEEVKYSSAGGKDSNAVPYPRNAYDRLLRMRKGL